jgi:hypothetical protein
MVLLGHWTGLEIVFSAAVFLAGIGSGLLLSQFLGVLRRR